MAAHGLFTAQAGRILDDPAISGLVVTDSIADVSQRIRPSSGGVAPALHVMSAASLLAQAIGTPSAPWAASPRQEAGLFIRVFRWASASGT